MSYGMSELTQVARIVRHPAKLTAGLRRRRFERHLRNLRIDVAVRLEHLGSHYGGWTVPVDVIDGSWTCYCVGAGSDVSFDMELLRRFGARVRSFDPLDEFGWQAEAQADGHSRYSFHRLAIAPADGPLDMFGSGDPGSGSMSAVDLYRSGDRRSVPGRSLPSLLQEFGDERVELLKLDIEGSEYAVLRDLDLVALGVQVLAIELHSTGSIAEALELVERTRGQGFALVHRAASDLVFLRSV